MIKNTAINQNLSSSNNDFLNTKNLILPSFSSHITDKNLWASNFLNKNNSDISKFLTSYNKDYISNFNSFEESREFFLKRSYIFLNFSNLMIENNLILNNQGGNIINLHDFNINNSVNQINLNETHEKFFNTIMLVKTQENTSNHGKYSLTSNDYILNTFGNEILVSENLYNIISINTHTNNTIWVNRIL